MLLFGITCNAKVDGQTYSLDELVSVLKANFEPPKVVFSETEKLKLRYVTGNIIKYQTEIKKIFESDVLEDQLAFPFQEVMRTGDTFKAFLQVHKENADLINLASDIIAGISQLAANPVVMKWLAYHVVDPTKKIALIEPSSFHICTSSNPSKTSVPNSSQCRGLHCRAYLY
mmetsp:Transcript_26572/g.29411  ORF Transcript_26572/g.29411 Transcript_26572/m.29411 type:complete len:172 (+) Transcript_26572:44-559(+)